MKVPRADLDYWLREAEAERIPDVTQPTDSNPAPAAQQHPDTPEGAIDDEGNLE